jgi:hypothetical protein
MKVPSKEEIKKEARKVGKRSIFLSDFPHDQLSTEYGFKKGAEWMEEQLEPIITELEMDKLRMTEAIISMIDKSTDTRVVNIGLKAINKTMEDLYPPQPKDR